MFDRRARHPRGKITPMFFQGTPGDDELENQVLIDIMSSVAMPETYKNVIVGGCGASVILFKCDHHIKSDMIATGLQNFVKRKADIHYASLAPEQRSTHRLRSVDQWEIVKSALKRIIIIEIFQQAKLECSLVSLRRLLDSNAGISLILINSINSFFPSVNLSSEIYHRDYIRRLLLLALDAVEGCHENIRIIYTEFNLFNKDRQSYDFGRPEEKLAVKEQIHVEEAKETYTITYSGAEV